MVQIFHFQSQWPGGIQKYEIRMELGILSLNQNLSKQVHSYEDFISNSTPFFIFMYKKKSDPLVKKDLIFPCTCEKKGSTIGSKLFNNYYQPQVEKIFVSIYCSDGKLMMPFCRLTSQKCFLVSTQILSRIRQIALAPIFFLDRVKTTSDVSQSTQPRKLRQQTLLLLLQGV